MLSGCFQLDGLHIYELKRGLDAIRCFFLLQHARPKDPSPRVAPAWSWINLHGNVLNHKDEKSDHIREAEKSSLKVTGGEKRTLSQRSLSLRRGKESWGAEEKATRGGSACNSSNIYCQSWSTTDCLLPLLRFQPSVTAED